MKRKAEGKRMKAEGLAGTQAFRLGKFTLVRGESGEVWLWHDDGGGMPLDEELVERSLEKYWRAKF